MSSSRTSSRSTGSDSPKQNSLSRLSRHDSPHEASSARAGSLRRPDFWIAMRRRSRATAVAGGLIQVISMRRREAWMLTTDRGGIAARAALERSRDAADGGDADLGTVVDLAIRHALEQQRHHPPAVRHGLELGRRAQV